MLTSISLIVLGASHAVAHQLQGILLPDRQLSTPGVTTQKYGPDMSFDAIVKHCAGGVAHLGYTKFEIRQERHLDAHGQPHGASEPYQCIYEDLDGTSENKAFQISDVSRLAICGPVCVKMAHFVDLPANSKLIDLEDPHSDLWSDHNVIVLAETPNFMSFNECKRLAAEYNSKLAATYPAYWGVPTIKRIHFSPVQDNRSLQRSGGERHQKTACYGYRTIDGDGIKEIKSYVGILSPLAFVKHQPAADYYVQKQLASVACTQKDIPYEFYPKCTEFAYDYNGAVQPNPSNLTHIEAPDQTQAIAYNSHGQKRGTTFWKIAQSSNQIASASSPENYTVEITAFGAEEAARSCALQASKYAGSHIPYFNLYLTDFGWKCAIIVSNPSVAPALSYAEASVIQSYLYSTYSNRMEDDGRPSFSMEAIERPEQSGVKRIKPQSRK